MNNLIILTGGIATGKSTLAQLLGPVLSTRQALVAHLEHNGGIDYLKDRQALQAEGSKLDDDTNGEWIVPYVLSCKGTELVVVDSVRDYRQIEAIRASPAIRGTQITHVHLVSPISAELRYNERGSVENMSFGDAKQQSTEMAVDQMAKFADYVINTDRCTPRDVALRVTARLFPMNKDRLVDGVIGAQYGSEGKGHVIAHLANEYQALVRVGGANAGHTVLFNGKPYTFKLLPSGTLHAPEAALILGPGMNIDVQCLLKEIKDCNAQHRTFIDPQANVVMPEDREDEKYVVADIGSTGQGVGKATARRITDRGQSNVFLAKDVPELREFLKPTAQCLDEQFRDGNKVMLEGTQGTGLSLYHGPYPYVTSRDTTISGCMAESGIPPHRIDRVVLVTRTNPIRVQSPAGGTSGPMEMELEWEEVSARAGIPANELRTREKTSTTKRQRRVAEFDWGLFYKACQLNGATDVALTFTDYISHSNLDARRFEQLTEETLAFIREIETVGGAPVSLITTRFHERSIIDRRSWRA